MEMYIKEYQIDDIKYYIEFIENNSFKKYYKKLLTSF